MTEVANLDQLDRVIEKLNTQGQTVAFAESCTGGLISSWVTSRSGVSSVFRGAVVSYAGDIKRDLLGVPEEDLKLHGEVSSPVAEQMAKGARKSLGSDWVVSVTGIAGPTGGSKEKPVGTVCFGLIGPEVNKVVCKNFDSSLSRIEIQNKSAEFALQFLLDGLS